MFNISQGCQPPKLLSSAAMNLFLKERRIEKCPGKSYRLRKTKVDSIDEPKESSNIER